MRPDFKTIFKENYRPMVYFADKIIANKEQAEDIVSEAMVKLWQRIDSFPNQTAVKSFLYLIVRNECFNYMKQQKRLFKKQSGYFVWSDDVEKDISYLIMKAETLNEITKMIETLPWRKKQVCKMAYMEGMAVDEIANKLNISIQTVWNLRALSINYLKEVINPSTSY